MGHTVEFQNGSAFEDHEQVGIEMDKCLVRTPGRNSWPVILDLNRTNATGLGTIESRADRDSTLSIVASRCELNGVAQVIRQDLLAAECVSPDEDLWIVLNRIVVQYLDTLVLSYRRYYIKLVPSRHTRWSTSALKSVGVVIYQVR